MAYGFMAINAAVKPGGCLQLEWSLKTEYSIHAAVSFEISRKFFDTFFVDWSVLLSPLIEGAVTSR